VATGPVGRFLYSTGDRPLLGYTVRRGIGHGGFGEVYFATSDAGKEVALKLIRRNLDVELRGVTQCLNLRHANLIDLYDVRSDEQDGTWVIMEHMAGKPLDEVVAGYPQGMPEAEALHWINGIGRGVNYLHDHGIVHRDLKPGNIFRDVDMVKIGDYGLTKFISCSRRSGQTESVGTVHYMAPEVANGRYGKQIDVYAMGIILYEMLTGQVPFDGESVGEVLMKHLTARPDLSVLAPAYRAVVERALRKDPQERYATAADMLADLPGGEPAPIVLAAAPATQSPAKQASATVAATDTRGEVGDPIGRAAVETWHEMRAAWHAANLSTTQKVGVLVLGVAVLVLCSFFLVPLVPVVGALFLLYVAYRIARAAMLMMFPSACGRIGHNRIDAPDGVQPARRSRDDPPRGARPRYRPHILGRRRAFEANRETVVKPARQRVTELLGSMLAGALIALVMCLVMLILNNFRGIVLGPEHYGWLAMVSIAGIWSVMIPSKFWEGTEGEAALRRFILMVVGMGIGAGASLAAAAFLVEPPLDQWTPQTAWRFPPTFYDVDGTPRMLAHVAAFGTMFLLIRWWRQTDPRRSTRLSLWSILFCTVVAGLVALGWHFPLAWLTMVAAVMSVSIQLASSRQPSRGANRP